MSEEEIEVTVDTSTEGDSQNQENSQEETVTLEQLNQEREARRQLTARAKKAEDELRNFKASYAVEPQIINKIPDDFAEELRLTSRGLSDEAIEQAKVVAKGKGISLTEATKDPLFTTYQDTLKVRERRENAKLGASRGSGETPKELSGLESGSSREDHLATFKKLNGSIK